MTQVLSLVGDGYECALAPSMGGAALHLRDRHGAILRAGAIGAVAADPRAAACFPCVPWFGRLYDGLSFAGETFAVRPTLPACAPDHPLHGDGWVGAWQVLRRSDRDATCQFVSRGDRPSAFPFAYDAEQCFRLDRDGLTIELSLRNQGDRPMPAGLGLHPYFDRRPATRVALTATGFWTPPSTGRPRVEGRHSAVTDGLGASVAAPLPATTLDHSFAGFGGEALVEGAGAPIRLSATAPILHVYAPEGEDYFCLEPVTHLPGAFTDAGNSFGGAVLPPGAALSLSMTIGRA